MARCAGRSGWTTIIKNDVDVNKSTIIDNLSINKAKDLQNKYNLLNKEIDKNEIENLESVTINIEYFNKTKSNNEEEQLYNFSYTRHYYKEIDFKNSSYIQSVSICRNIANALFFLHKYGIIHGNLTPSNIGINNKDNIIIFDYGLYFRHYINGDSKRMNNTFINLSRIAPESIKYEKSSYDEKTDIYSMGLIFLGLINGDEHPYKNMSILDVYLSKKYGEIPVIKSDDNELVTLTKKCLSADPIERPTAEECLEILNKMLKPIEK